MKYSEFYKLIESAGWTIKKGTNHYKYVHPDFDYFIPVGRHPAKEIPNGTLDSMMIEKANDGGISIYSEDVNGAYGFGLTEQEAKDDFLSVLEEQAEYYKEKHGEFPVWYKSGYSVSYIYDLSGFFEAFPFINASKFAKEFAFTAPVCENTKERSLQLPKSKRL